jgi:hypothetical protein
MKLFLKISIDETNFNIKNKIPTYLPIFFMRRSIDQLINLVSPNGNVNIHIKRIEILNIWALIN